MQTEIIRSFDELNKLLPATAKRRVANNHERAANQIRMERLLSFIYNYQRTHGGATPPITVMANEMETSEQQVSRYVNMLNDDGLIYIIDRGPLRVMIKHPFEVVPLVDARRLDNAIKPKMLDHSAPQKEALSRYEAAEARRQQLARFIGQTWQDKGRGPYIKEMMVHLGSKSPGHIDGMLSILADRGMITRPGEGKTGQTKLTEAGDTVYGFSHKKAQPAPQQTKEEVVMKKKVDGRRGPHMNLRRQKLLDYIRSYYGEHKRSPSYKEMKEAVGLKHDPTLSQALNAFEQLGLVKRNRQQQGMTVIPVEFAEKEEVKRVIVPKPDNPPRGTALSNMKKMLVGIKEGSDTYGVPPDMTELAKLVGYTDSGARMLVHKMADLGWVQYRKGNLGTLRLTERGERVYAHEHPHEAKAEPGPSESATEFTARDAAISKLALPSVEDQKTLEQAGPQTVRLAPDIMPVPEDAVRGNPGGNRGFSLAAPSEAEAIKDADTADLVLELIERGFVVRRA